MVFLGYKVENLTFESLPDVPVFKITAGLTIKHVKLANLVNLCPRLLIVLAI